MTGRLRMARNGAGFLVDPETDKAVWIEERDLGTALVEAGCRERQCAIFGEASYDWMCTYLSLMALGAVTVGSTSRYEPSWKGDAVRSVVTPAFSSTRSIASLTWTSLPSTEAQSAMS